MQRYVSLLFRPDLLENEDQHEGSDGGADDRADRAAAALRSQNVLHDKPDQHRAGNAEKDGQEAALRLALVSGRDGLGQNPRNSTHDNPPDNVSHITCKIALRAKGFQVPRDGHNLRVVSSEDFAVLTYEEQVARLQSLGEQALDRFGVEPVEINPLAHFENTSFYVKAATGDEFNLRISRPGQQSQATLQSEIEFLTALRAEGFRVPEPYQHRIVEVGAEGVPEERNVVLFRWMHGEFLRDKLTPVEARLIGQMMAQLHAFTTRWQRPPSFQRASLHAWALTERKPSRIDQPIEGLPEEDRLLLLELDKQARDMLRSLPQTPETFGLIHSDLHVGNVLVEDGHLNVIDFDDTGFGFLYYDFGAALGFHLLEPLYQPIREALLAGYEEVRPLPPNTRELLNAFIKIRMTGVSRWIMDRVDNPRLKDTGPSWVHGFCEGMRTLD